MEDRPQLLMTRPASVRVPGTSTGGPGPSAIPRHDSRGDWRTNALFTDAGDILMGTGSESGSFTEPAVVGQYTVATPRAPASPLLAQLKAKAARDQKLREERILDSSLAATSSSASHAFFPSFQHRLGQPEGQQFPFGTAAAAPQRTLGFGGAAATVGAPAGSAPAVAAAGDDDDDDSVEDIMLDDDGPNPLCRVGGDVSANTASPPAADSGTLLTVVQPLGVPSASRSGAPGVARAYDGGRRDWERGFLEDEEGAGDAAAVAALAPDAAIAIPATTAGPAPLVRDSTPAHDKQLNSLLVTNVQQFATACGPLLAAMKCYIVREKGTAGLLKKAPHVYKVYHEDTNTFLFGARRRMRTKTPSYLVSLNEREMQRGASSYFGKIKSNFLGTEFTVYDAGERATKKSGSINRASSRLPHQHSAPLRASSLADPNSRASSASSGDAASGGLGDDAGAEGRGELAVVQYHMNVMGTKGPRKMVIGIPYVDFDTNAVTVWRPTRPQDSMMAQLKRPAPERMIKLVNKAPKWNATLGAYCLNFNGRVTQASVKNFQLVSDGDEQDRDVLQFGRVSEDRFTMDYRWPLTAYQAFCICITSLDNKLACE